MGKAKKVTTETALGQCAWCGKTIRQDRAVYGMGARKRPGIDLSELEGSAILVTLSTVPKEVICIVSGSDSQAKADGKDFLFMTCSEKCAKELKATMDADVELGNTLFGNLEEMSN